jgi:hypothetical protein
MPENHKQPSKYSTYIVAVFLILIGAYFVWIYGGTLGVAYQLSNYTGQHISANLNSTLNYLQYHYNQTFNTAQNKTENMTNFYIISTNLPIPDYYSMINILLVIATALLALWAIIALEIYKNYKLPESKNKTSESERVWRKRSILLLLGVPALTLLMAILLFLNSLFVYSFVQIQTSSLISAIHIHAQISGIVKALELEVQEITQQITFGTQFLVGGAIFSIVVPITLMYMEVVSSKKASELGNNVLKWLKEHPKVNALVLLLIFILMAICIIFLVNAYAKCGINIFISNSCT